MSSFSHQICSGNHAPLLSCSGMLSPLFIFSIYNTEVLYSKTFYQASIVSSVGHSMALKAAEYRVLEPKHISKPDAKSTPITMLLVRSKRENVD